MNMRVKASPMTAARAPSAIASVRRAAAPVRKMNVRVYSGVDDAIDKVRNVDVWRSRPAAQCWNAACTLTPDASHPPQLAAQPGLAASPHAPFFHVLRAPQPPA